MAARTEIAEERRAQILEAAIKAFTRRGFHEARMDDIVEESGLSKGAIYWYFKSKDDIIRTLLDRFFSREFHSAADRMANIESARQKLQTALDFFLEALDEMRPLMPILFDYWGLVSRRKRVRQALRKYYRGSLDFIIPIIQQGIDQGEFREVDAEGAAIAMVAIFEGAIVLWAADPERVKLEKNIDLGIGYLIRGLEKG